jgi:hypothetical protein
MKRQTKWILVTLMAIGGLAALLGTASQAIWTDTDPVGTNDFATGSVGLTTSPTDTIWTAVVDAAPGTIKTGQLTVTNGGTLELRYAISGGNTDAALAAGMNLRIGEEGITAGCEFPYHNDDGTLITLTDDTPLFAGTLDTALLIGNAAQGQDATPGGGDRTLTVPAGSEVLCFSVVLPLGADNSLQSLSNTTTFTFDSEQTLNN